MSYKRTVTLIIVFSMVAGFFYVYEIRGSKVRIETERAEKLLLSLNPDDTAKMALRRPDEVIALEKIDGTWTIIDPITAPADESTLEQILNALAELKYERDIGAQKELQQFGLDKPILNVEIEGVSGNLGKLLFGGPTPDGSKFYVMLADREQVFTVDNSFKNRIDKTLFNLRKKDVLDFASSDVARVTITRNAKTLALRRDQETGKWTIVFPDERVADASMVHSLLDSIGFSRINNFVEEEASDLVKYGLAEPVATMVLECDDWKSTLLFGNKATPESNRVYAITNGAQQVVELDTDILDKLVTDVPHWRDTHLLQFERSKVARIQIDSDLGTRIIERLEKNDDEWTMVEPQQAFADENEMRNLLFALEDSRIARFLEKDEMQAASKTITAPLARLQLWESESETPVVLAISKSEDGRNIYAKTDRSEEIFSIGEQLLEQVNKAPEQLKDRSVLRFKETDVERIEIARGEKSFVIKRKDVRWKLPRDLEMESYEIDQFLWELRQLRYRRITATEEDERYYGFDSPLLSIILSIVGTDNPLRLEIGKKVSAEDLYYARHSDTHQVMEIEGAPLTEWLEKLSQERD